jgi:hypothetical protein
LGDHAHHAHQRIRGGSCPLQGKRRNHFP